MKKCQICKKLIKDDKKLFFGHGGHGEIHLTCYTPSKQKDYDSIRATRTYHGESSPYWEWVEHHADRSNDGEYQELPQANPDVLAETWEYQNRRDELQGMIEEVYQKLSPKETRVFNLLIQHETEEEIARKIGVSRSRVQNLRRGIIKKFKTPRIKMA